MGKRRKSLRREQLRSAAQKQKSTLNVLVPKPVIAAPVPAPVAAPVPAPVAAPKPEIVHAADLASPRSPKITAKWPTSKGPTASKRTSDKK